MAELEAANPAVTAYIQRGVVPKAPKKINTKVKAASSKPSATPQAPTESDHPRAAMVKVRPRAFHPLLSTHGFCSLDSQRDRGFPEISITCSSVMLNAMVLPAL